VTVDGIYHVGSFHAAPAVNVDQLKFIAYGDTRTYPETHDIVAEGMLSDFKHDPAYQSLVVGVGDLVTKGREEDDWDSEFFDAPYSNIQELLASVPFHSCIGNHELSGSGTDLFLKYFPYPYVGDHYWSYDYGPAHFVVVDQYVDYSAGSPQLSWVESDLASSTKPWKFICLHEPGWSAGGHSNEADVQEIIQPLCEAYNVSVVFAGHNHYYARAVKNSVQHITTGGGGAPLYNPNPGAQNVVASSKSHHYCRIEINGNRLFFEAVQPDGTVIDAFIIIDDDLYVDASNTSGPWDGSQDNPFQRIQEGINSVGMSRNVTVAPGTYTENLYFKGKATVVKSSDGAPDTVIDAGQMGSGVSFAHSENLNAVIEGFTITNGGSVNGGGINCFTSSPTIRNNIIVGNSALNYGGGLYGGGTVLNNTICKNIAGIFGGGVYDTTPANRIVNCIFWDNTAFIGHQIFGNPDVAFCDVQGGYPGSGNIDFDPLFVDQAINDFHLLFPSPCRDAGDSSLVKDLSDFEGDPRVAWDGIVDIGADEFYTHLYYTGDAIPNYGVDLKLIGQPTNSATLCLGTEILNQPNLTKHGDWWLVPPHQVFDLYQMPWSGVILLRKRIPPDCPIPMIFPVQGMVRGRLTNLCVVEVE